MKTKRLLLKDKTIIVEKIKESFSSVMPIILLVLVLALTFIPIESGLFLAFITGSVLVIIGIGLFTLGADVAMTPIGEFVGSSILKTRKTWLIGLLFFIVGVVITIAEPDLQILAGQLSETVGYNVLLLTIGFGVGFYLVVAFLRIILKIKFQYIIIASYGVVFALYLTLMLLGLENFLPIAFDSGGVTTGPMSVPFIIALGTGIVSIRTDKNGDNTGFGITSLCSIGPIISVMVLGIIFHPSAISVSLPKILLIDDSTQIFPQLFDLLPRYLKEVGIALLPIMVLFFVFVFVNKISRHNFLRIILGVVYTYVGLVLFLSGVNFGFNYVGYYLGNKIGQFDYNWIVIPLGMLIGFFVVVAEPAVHVLTGQVYSITGGKISKNSLRLSLMFGVSISVGLAMLRIYLNISFLYFIIPFYVFAIALTFFTPEIFSAIAFDAGGVASGAMTACFVLPFALGVCSALNRDLSLCGFGIIAFVAMTPLVTIQIFGLRFKIKQAKLTKHREQIMLRVLDDIQIIE